MKTKIGCSGFKVDVGIIDPNDTSRYMLGILCDGENYRAAKTARDREIVQDSVLKMLGWNICKVWTLDWWEDSQKVIDHIEAELKELSAEIATIRSGDFFGFRIGRSAKRGFTMPCTTLLSEVAGASNSGRSENCVTRDL